MFRNGILVFLSSFLAVLLASPAAAQSSDLPSNLTALAPGESLVVVRELPRVDRLRLPSGAYLDLGFKFGVSDDGEWVGYAGSSTSYVRLDQVQLEHLLEAGGLAELPPRPAAETPAGVSSPGSSLLNIIVVLAAVAAALIALRRTITRLVSGASRHDSSVAYQQAEAYFNAQSTSSPTPPRAARNVVAVTEPPLQTVIGLRPPVRRPGRAPVVDSTLRSRSLAAAPGFGRRA